MLISIALLGLAQAEDRFVDTRFQVYTAINDAPTSGNPEDFRVFVLPGSYNLDKRDLDHKRMSFIAVVPGTVVFNRNNDSRIFSVRESSDLVFDGIDFDGNSKRIFTTQNDRSASISISRARFFDGDGDGGGRAGYINHDSDGTVSLTNVEFQAATTSDSDGGHIRARGGTLSVVSSRFIGGDASGNGGCISADATLVDISSSIFQTCRAADNGGALHIFDSPAATITRSWFEDSNADEWGGSIQADASSLTLVDTMVCVGTTDNEGAGGLYFTPDANQDLTVQGSVFLNNDGDNNNRGGGAIRVAGGGNSTVVDISYSSFVSNTSGGAHAGRFEFDNPNATIAISDSNYAHHFSNSLTSNLNSNNATFVGNSIWPANWTPNGFGSPTYSTVDPGFPVPGPTDCDASAIVPTNGILGAFEFGFIDADGDGHYAPIDCDDDPITGAAIHPGAPDLCDGIDNDCDFLIDEDATPGAFFLDKDSDGFGDEAITGACEPGMFVAAVGGDCDDDDPAVFASLDYYPDVDGDGFGDQGAAPESSCTPVADKVEDNTDCDDSPGSGASVNPGQPEICDGIDNDCAGGIDDGLVESLYYPDADNDTFGDRDDTGTLQCGPLDGRVVDNRDCNDSASMINPDADEVCDTVDNDCDDEVDEDGGSVTYTTWYRDADEDGFGRDNPSIDTCDGIQPDGYVDNNDDCADFGLPGAAQYPGNPEICDGLDNDCDGTADNGLTLVTYYLDDDGDTYGDPTQPQATCDGAPPDHVTDSSDCDDDDPTVNPLGIEICDNVDNNCDTVADEASAPAISYTTWYRDQDGDTFGTPTDQSATCDGTPPSGYVASNTDCNDGANDVSPAGVEICDGIDNNCDTVTDEASAPGVTYTTWYRDRDGDDFGVAVDQTATCNGVAPSGYVAADGDCQDDFTAVSSLRYPGNAEVCDGIDNDCDPQNLVDNGLTFQLYYPDDDDDGFGFEFGPALSACSPPADHVLDNTDCDDNAPNRFPGNTEVCNGIDNDCANGPDDGLTFVDYFRDADDDTFGDPNIIENRCDGAPMGFVVDGTDCDDDATGDGPVRFPGNPEVCDGIDNDCANGPDDGLAFVEYFLDADDDTFGDPDTFVSRCDGAPAGYVVDGTDCDDDAAGDGPIRFPGNTEVCDGVDNDCDPVGEVDNGIPFTSWWRDADGDTYGDDSVLAELTCDGPPEAMGWVDRGDDCQDDLAADPLAASIHIGAIEFCDGVDNDCDGMIDEEAVAPFFYPDADLDGFGDDNDAGIETCSPPAGWVAVQGDCDDMDPLTSPIAFDDTCNGVDNNCNGLIDEEAPLTDGYLDLDGDGYGDGGLPTEPVQCEDGYAANGDDCDDTDPTVNPAVLDDNCNGQDDNCNGIADENGPLAPSSIDADGDGSVVAGPEVQCAEPLPDVLDCDDTRADFYPGSPDLQCGADANCDGQLDDDDPLLDCTISGVTPLPPPGGGCNCDSGAPVGAPPMWALGLLGLLGLRRRR